MTKEKKATEFDVNEMPYITTRIKTRLPRFILRVVEQSENKAEEDAMLLGTLTTLSAAMPKLEGQYGRRTVYPNLYFFLSAPAASGKGNIALCRNLVMPIHIEKKLQRKAEIERITAEQESEGKKVTAADLNIPQKMMIIPGDSTATAMYQALGDNDGVGLISETEADTLVKSLGGDFGFSDGLRKAFHHETISYCRRKENEMVEIENPRLSVMLAGTPKQVYRLMPDAEDGLFSRFMLYRMPRNLEWKDVFAASPDGKSADETFAKLGREYYRFYKSMLDHDGKIEFELTDEQKTRFNAAFERMQTLMSDVYGDDIVASVRRMGLIIYRISMILSVLRLMDYGRRFVVDRVICTDEDFEIAMWISEVLIKHTIMIYREMPEGLEAEKNFDLKETISKRLLNGLPEQFTRVEALEAGEDIDLSNSTVDFYLRFMKGVGMLNVVKRGVYEKVKEEAA